MKLPLSSLVIVLLLSSTIGLAQKPLRLKHDEAGIFSIGVRSGLMISNSTDRWNVGQGLGLQFRIMPTRHMNTEWYFEMLKGGYSEFGVRSDVNIGGSVFLYPQRKLQRAAPFLAIGPCVTLTTLRDRLHVENKVSRWSIGGQAGIGMHVNLTRRSDLTISTGYLLHYGQQIQIQVDDNAAVMIPKEGSNVDGEFLFNVSMNFVMADLWKRLRFR